MFRIWNSHFSILISHYSHNTTLHSKSPLKICGIWLKFQIVTDFENSAESVIWNLAFKHHRQIWNFIRLRLLNFQICLWCLTQIPNYTLRRRMFMLEIKIKMRIRRHLDQILREPNRRRTRWPLIGKGRQSANRPFVMWSWLWYVQIVVFLFFL